MRLGSSLLLVASTATCTIDAATSESFEGGGFSVDDDGTVELDTAKVPVVDTCSEGQFIRRASDGWQCVEPTSTSSIDWTNVNGIPGGLGDGADWTDINGRPTELDDGVDWGDIAPAGIPAGLGDGDDDALGALAAGCSVGQAVVEGPSEGAWQCMPAGTLVEGAGYPSASDVAAAVSAIQTGTPNKIVVSPTSTPSLTDAVSAAGAAATAASPWLVELLPGEYDLGASRLVIPGYVHVSGAGRGLTRILVGTDGDRAVQITEDGVVLQHLAIDINSAYPVGVHIEGAITARVRDVDVTAVATENSLGVHVQSGAHAILDDVRVDAQGGGIDCRGVNFDGASEGEIYRSQVTVSGADAAKGVCAVSVTAGNVKVVDSSVKATATGTAYGLYLDDVSANIYSSHVEAAGNSSVALKTLTTSSSYTVHVHGSRLLAPTGGTMDSVSGSSAYTIHMANTELQGSASAGGGTMACAYCFNDSFQELTTSCTGLR